MSQSRGPDPLHGVTLQTIVETLVERYGWESLSQTIAIRCFTFEPSVKSSLKFLRKTPWARAEVEALFVQDQRRAQKNSVRNQERAQRRLKGAAVRAAANELGANESQPAVAEFAEEESAEKKLTEKESTDGRPKP